MTDKRALMSTAGLKSPLLGADGHPLNADTVKITIASMPVIDRDAMPGLPDDLEARLFNVPGQYPRILLVHPPSELFIEVSLLDRDNLSRYVEALTTARLKQAMGEPPDAGDGYRVGE